MNFRQKFGEMSNRFDRFFAADAGNGVAGGGKPGDTSTQTSTTGETKPETKTTVTPEEFTALKAAHDHAVKTHLEMKDKWQKREEADRVANEAALAKQGEFQKLYETAKAELDPMKARLERYEAVVKKYYEAEVKGLDKAMSDVIPEGDEVTKLEWLAKAKASGLIGSKPATATGDKTKAPGGTKAQSGLKSFLSTKR